MGFVLPWIPLIGGGSVQGPANIFSPDVRESMDVDPGQLTPRTQGTVEPSSSHPQRALVPDFPDFTLSSQRTALLIVDMQYLDAHPKYGVGAAFREKGLFHLVAPYFDRLSATVIPNI